MCQRVRCLETKTNAVLEIALASDCESASPKSLFALHSRIQLKPERRKRRDRKGRKKRKELKGRRKRRGLGERRERTERGKPGICVERTDGWT
jgi:hypothetical protein